VLGYAPELKGDEMSDDLLSPAFSEHLNTKFRTRLADSREAEFELIKVEDRGAPSGYECFSLLFRAPLDAPAEQRIYTLDHEQMPATEIFLVPIRNEPNGLIFEAVFNRLTGD
jgi:hypothetical protein